MTTATKINELEINGTTYVPKGSTKPTGPRVVLVVDRGWIFAGDCERIDGRIKLTRAVHVFRWESIGFDGVLANPKSSKVTLKPLKHDVDVPAGAEVFCIPVEDDWGL